MKPHNCTELITLKTQRQLTGRTGEEEACIYLQRLGHTILDRNWRASHLETDIVSLDRAGLHFVEVKTRRAPVAADPAVNVDRRKMQRMVQAAQRYLHDPQRKLPDVEVFFDVITVILDGDGITLEYYPQAFIPTYV